MIRLLNVYFSTKGVLLFVVETLIVIASFFLAVFYLMGPSEAYVALFYEHGLLKILGLAFVVVLMSYYFDLYEPALLFDEREIYFRTLMVLGVVCLLISGLLYFEPDIEIANNSFPLSFAIMSVLLMAWRRITPVILGSKYFRENVYILGKGEYAEKISNIIRSRRDLGMDVIGCHYCVPDGYELLDSSAAVVQSLIAMPAPPSQVLIAMPDRRGELPTEELLRLRFKGVNIEEAHSLLERLYGKIQLSSLRPSDFLYVEGFRVRPSQQFTRRVASFLASLILLTLFLPFFPIVVLLVRFSSPGPIFIRQVRVGMGGKNFTVYKFRSMRADAEATGAKWAQKNDPRVTRWGLIMRKTRIDEIPQLWCVLRGDMGFVGPRPERPEFVPWLAEQLPFYNLRHVIRPGLTGWAQVRYGYGATLEQAREKLEYDLYYVKHASLGLDLLIMFETIKTILHRKGAQ